MMQAVTKDALGALMFSLVMSCIAGAQAQSANTVVLSTATTKIATRQLPAASATSTVEILSVAAVRQLPNGTVLVNDQTKRRLIILDKDLKLAGVVADTTSGNPNQYGTRPGGLIAYRGDSTLFVDPASLSMLLVDASGKVVRTMAAPRASDVNFLMGGPLGNPGFDTRGRLVYRTMDFGFRGRGQPGQPFTPPSPPDSSALVRFDLATRKLDTAGFYKIPKANVTASQDANGRMSVTMTVNPLPVVDEWAVVSDGTIAFVRGHDYHVDFIDGNGVKTVADKIPYEWQRMTDDDKTRFLDSAKVAIEKMRDSQRAAGGSGGFERSGVDRSGIESAASALGLGGMPMMVTMSRERSAGGDRAQPRVEIGGAPGGPGGPSPINMVPISDLPDYKPVFGPGAVKADMDGRLWVRTIPTKATTGGTIYDVIDRSGKLVDRLQVPAGTTIAGFGAGGIVYLGLRDATGLHVQRISLK